jgi:predicted PurR-regulated permease PerM
MRAAQTLVSQWLLAAFLAVVCFPPLSWLERKRVPTGLALLIVIAAVALGVLVVAAMVGASINDFYGRLPEYTARLAERNEGLLRWLEAHGVELDAFRNQQGFDARRLLDLATTLIGSVGSLSSNVFVILLVFVFILLEGAMLPAKLAALSEQSDRPLQQFEEVMENVRRYVAIKTQVSLLTGLLVTLLLLVLGIDYAPLWGLLAFLFNFVPNIGSILAAVPAVLLAYIQLDLSTAVVAGAGYLILNLVIGNIVEPRVMGRGLGLSTLVVLLSLLFWGWVLGPVGMLLSVPLTMIAKIVLQGNDETRWIAILLDSEPPASESA